jgi:hypothetical protein
MKKNFISAGLLAILFLLCDCNDSSTGNPAVKTKTKEEQVKRGAYLTMVMGCNDCHTPKKFGPMGPELDTSRILSGHPADLPVAKFNKAILKDWSLMGPMLSSYAGPWGVSFAANLTSDTATGIGIWSYEQFKTAMVKGKSKGMENNRTLIPPMPWQNYANIEEEDLRDIFAFLKSTKPVNNLVPAPISPDKLP